MKLGVIGCGQIFDHYIDAIKRNHGLELVAICDIDKLKRSKARTIGAKFYDDYKKLIESPVDAVIIATPNFLHADMSIYALKHGKSVLCEKPMATSINDAERMMLTAQKTGMVLKIAYHLRYKPEVQELLKMDYEKIVEVESYFLENWQNASEWYYSKEKCGGGPLIDNGINTVDIIVQFVGRVRVNKSKLIYGKHEVEDQAKIEFEFDGGHGIHTSSWVHEKPVWQTTLINDSEQRILMDHYTDELYIDNKLEGRWKDKRYEGVIQAFVNQTRKNILFNHNDFLPFKAIMEAYDISEK